MTFNIVVPTYNNLLQLKKCVESLNNLDHNSYHVFICDNGSSDGTIDYLTEFCHKNLKFTLLQHPDKTNKGRAANRNQALPYLNSKYVLFIDSDLYANPDLLKKHENCLLQNINSVSIGKTNYVNENGNKWAYYLSRRGTGKLKNKDKSDYKYFTTQNVVLPSNLFTELKGFDENMFYYGGDDTEFACRLMKHFNCDFYVNNDAICFSKMDKNLSKALDHLEEFGAINLKYILQKHPDCNIFNIDLLMKKDLKSLIYQSILNPFFYFLSYQLAQILPSILNQHLINLCVAYRIKKGYFKN